VRLSGLKCAPEKYQPGEYLKLKHIQIQVYGRPGKKGKKKPSQVQTGPSKTPVAVVLGLVIIIKPITLADFALVGLVCLAVLMIFGAGVSGSGS